LSIEDITVSLVAFDGYPLETAVDVVAALGVKSVEPAMIAGYTDPFDESAFSDEHAQAMRSTVEDAGLGCDAFSAHIDIGAPGGVEQAFRRLRFAGALGAKRLATNAAKEGYRESFLAAIEPLAREAERSGVVIALENPGDGAPNVIDDAAAAARLVRSIGSPWIGINYDPGNLLTHRPDTNAAEDVRAFGPGLVSLHVKDAAPEGEWLRYCAVGEGVIDYEAILRHCDTLDPRPAYSIEAPLRLARKPGGTTKRDETPRPLEEIREALRASIAWMVGH
ncbi:MAG: sugar phosphate isomerase/epimerase family protein, partial [Spirochaetota bacterium]